MNAPIPLPDWMDPNPSTEVDQTPVDEFGPTHDAALDRAAAQTRHELRAAVGNSQAIIELEKQTYEIAFETALEAMVGGTTLTDFCHKYHQPISPVRFRTWMLRDERRKAAYHMAKALWAEELEDELIRISDGVGPDGQPTMDTEGRSALRINTRKWVMEKMNRKRYGDVKHVEQTSTSSMTIDVNSMSTADLKRFILRQAGADALDASAIEAIVGQPLGSEDEDDDE